MFNLMVAKLIPASTRLLHSLTARRKFCYNYFPELLVSMQNRTPLVLEPAKAISDRSLHLAFNGIGLVLGNSPLPLHFSIAKTP